MSGQITSEMIMDLRKRTGVGISKCKEALTEANGNIEEAVHILRKKGMASAVKKGGRETKEGLIGFAENDKVAYLVEVAAETDFVTQNQCFRDFLDKLCQEAVRSTPDSVDALLKETLTDQPSLTIEEYRTETVHALGENIQIKRILGFEKQDRTSLGIYSHMGGKIVCVVVIKGASDQIELARLLAMHIAAEAPDYLAPSAIPPSVIAKEEELARSQIQNKPAAVIDKIVQGKMKTYYQQSCLLCQNYIKDPSLTVAQFIEKEGEKTGNTLEVTEFVRWQIGE